MKQYCVKQEIKVKQMDKCLKLSGRPVSELVLVNLLKQDIEDENSKQSEMKELCNQRVYVSFHNRTPCLVIHAGSGGVVDVITDRTSSRGPSQG